MKIPIYQADAFASGLFRGNPAAICPLDHWLPDELLQSIAAENNLSETAFVVKESDGYRIRWFTPAAEVDLCGHATLAAAHVFYSHLGFDRPQLNFQSRSGWLRITRQPDERITLDFPVNKPITVTEVPEGIFEGLNIQPVPVFRGAWDYLVLLPNQTAIEELKPNFNTLAKAKCRGIIATAKGDQADFVSRCFYPQSGINEDPVTGSAHTIMIPFWAEKLGKTKMKAIQLSSRRGHLDCELVGDRVLISGHAVTYMTGEIQIETNPA
jgi:PhzF family phenazine biosynthesis protein